ncbi:ABC transporter ATP-binding protein [Azonexus sp. IMCC34842]|uniref:ABC transporter ATP-binding protein n=1 Tax=Azonexus sp. IMCC34842 TaxID=3420950 RepID=UPI003D099B53
MTTIAISVEGLSKRYLLGHQNTRVERYTVLRDVIAHSAINLGRKTIDMLRGRPIVEGDQVEEFWALKDISFDIRHGDRVGIIGQNGAGKSTLLKILSRVTEPTNGQIKLGGKVASLLEVGTGFHPELTGRENIFLNGAILGMTRTDIRRKFDEIVAFAETEKFLDTPVKRYSSGMYVRLAFAVAAHLEPEILVVDEVLAVGDAAFQKKCLGKMEQVGSEGRTVLFVSHNMAAITNLCSRAILLSNGELKNIGRASDVIDDYLKINFGNSEFEANWDFDKAPGDKTLKLIRISVKQSESGSRLFDSMSIKIKIELKSKNNIQNFAIGCIISNSQGMPVLHTQSNLGSEALSIDEGINLFTFDIPPYLLRSGKYFVSIGAAIPNIHNYFMEQDVISFRIETLNSAVIRQADDTWKGFFNPQVGHWQKI